MITGKTRYRMNWRGKLILQVEEEVPYCYDLNGSGYYDTGSYMKWRDATSEDLINGEIPKRKSRTTLVTKLPDSIVGHYYE